MVGHFCRGFEKRPFGKQWNSSSSLHLLKMRQSTPITHEFNDKLIFIRQEIVKGLLEDLETWRSALPKELEAAAHSDNYQKPVQPVQVTGSKKSGDGDTTVKLMVRQSLTSNTVLNDELSFSRVSLASLLPQQLWSYCPTPHGRWSLIHLAIMKFARNSGRLTS